MGSIEAVMQLACATVVAEPSLPEPQVYDVLVDPAELVVRLGNPQALATVAVVPNAPCAEEACVVIDFPELIRSLGRVVAVEIIEPVDPAELVVGLGNPQALATVAMVPNAPCAKEACVIDLPELIRSLGRVVEIELVEPVDIADLVCALGNPARTVDLAVPHVPEPNESLLDVAELLLQLGTVVVPEYQHKSLLDVEELILRLGAADIVCPVFDNQESMSSELNVLENQESMLPRLEVVDSQTPTLDVSNIITNLGGVYTPDFILCNVKRVRKASTQTLVDEDTCCTVSMDAAPDHYGCTFPSIPLSTTKLQIVHLAPALLELSTTDVDEAISQDPRSRTSSIVSYNQPFESMHGISKLMAALNIRPIMVSRPFLGPSRTVLFPHLY
ncbi:hypothetical protein IWW50_003276 [Coemansia erecta]|nr:hypothetical protein IWW50_003276 [Coemansia erecta]